MIHLTLTGPNAGTAACMAVKYELPSFGGLPLPEGDTGAHYAYAPADMIDGTRPGVCPECVAAFRDADDDDEEN